MGELERQFVHEAFDSNFIAPCGPMVDAFEREFAEYTGFSHAVALASGTAATHLALRHLLGGGKSEVGGRRSEVGGRRSEFGGRGSEVGDRRAEVRSPKSEGGGSGPRPIVYASTLTFIGSVTPATFEGCDLRFIDCDRESWNMDPDLLAEELERCEKAGERPAAVIPTDLYGQCCDLPRIREICDRFAIPVICDSAEAVGAQYFGVRSSEFGGRRTEIRTQRSETGTEGEDRRPGDTPPTSEVGQHAGRDAWAAVYSFNGNKIITTSGGGMLASDDEELIAHARKLSTQARDPAPHYQHSEIGFNYRMGSLAAAVGRGQLRVLDERVKRRRAIFDQYRSLLGHLPGLAFMPEASYNCANRWLTVVLIDQREFGVDTNTVREALEAENIEARPVWKPMHMQPVFEGCRAVGGAVSEELFEKGLCLPSGTAMTDDDLDRVAEIVRRVQT